MPLVELNLTNLNDLDEGRVATAFVHELKRVVLDCMDRPGDKSARTVSLVFKLAPVIADDGSCESANGEFAIHSATPKRKSKTYNFSVNKRGHLGYSQHSEDNAAQRTLDDVSDKFRE
jgi:hypothetical protein